MSRKVLVVTPIIRPGGGPPGYVHNLMTGYEELKSLRKNKNSFTFLGAISDQRNKATGERTKSANSLRSALIGVLTKMGLKPFLSKKIRHAKKSIRASELVVFQGFQDLYLVRYASSFGIPIIYMPHSPSIMADEYKMLCELNGSVFSHHEYEKLRLDEAELLTLATAIVFPAKGAAKEYVTAFSDPLKSKKIVYIKSGVNVDFTRKKTNASAAVNDVVNIIFAGRYVTHKGYDLFCEAANLIGDTLGQVNFKTLGAGPMKRSDKYVFDLGWRNDVFDVLDAADIVVIPNRVAYYDLLPLECAALGKPLVMTSVGGNVDQMHDLPDSMPCTCVDSTSLAFIIGVAIEKYRRDATWGMANKIAFDKIFTVVAFAKRWDDSIENILH